MIENHPETRKKKPVNSMRLAARITGSIWVVVILFFNIGYLVDGYQRNGNQFALPDDHLALGALIFLYIGVAGLIIAFWKTLPGVILSTIGFLGASLFLIFDPKLTFSFIALLAVLIPTILYFSYWRDTRNAAKYKALKNQDSTGTP